MIVVDSREKIPTLLDGCDERRLLEYDAENHYSFDFLIQCVDGTELKVERKSYADAMQSRYDGKLDFQVAAVDLLIVEKNATMLAARRPADPKGAVEHDRANKALQRHLDRLALSVPVVYTSGPKETLELMRYYEGHSGLRVFENRVQTAKGDFWDAFFAALPGINPDRVVDDHGRLGDILKPDAETRLKIAELLNLKSLADLPGFASRSVEKATDAILK